MSGPMDVCVKVGNAYYVKTSPAPVAEDAESIMGRILQAAEKELNPSVSDPEPTGGKTFAQAYEEAVQRQKNAQTEAVNKKINLPMLMLEQMIREEINGKDVH